MMVSGITESTIDAIKVRTVLSELIESYGIDVRRSGIGAKKAACCPFHKEKTPSFSINNDKGYYHCFGCGESGDAIKFVQKMEGITFVDAVKKLAARCGVTIEENTRSPAEKKSTTQPIRNRKETENMDNQTTQTNQPTEAELVLQKKKEKFVSLLQSTHREGLDKVIAGLEKLGFFTAPASSKHHLAEKGGLLHHSLNVYEQAALIREIEVGIKPELAEKLPNESIIIASLLHDVCKAEIYKLELKNKKNEQTGQWEKVPQYVAHYEHCPMGHGEKSVIRLLRMGLELTNDEILAIRWHMGAWDLSDSFEAKGNLGAACEKSPLLDVIMAADELATRVTEVLYEKQKKEAEEATDKEKKEEGQK